MNSRRSRHYDDFDDHSVAKQGGNTALVVGLAVGGAAILLTCVCGVGIVGVVIFSRSGTQPDEFVGTWKGNFVLNGQPTDVIYRFDKSGQLDEEHLDLQGRRIPMPGGRWRFRNGQIIIDFVPIGTEVAVVAFVDNNTIDYTIVSHTDPAQIGLKTTFRRQ